MEADTSHVGDGTLNGFVEFELTTDIACCQTGVLTTLLARHQPLQTYPTPTPVALLQQSDTEALGLAPGRLTLVGKYLYLPATLHAALQLLASVWNP